MGHLMAGDIVTYQDTVALEVKHQCGHIQVRQLEDYNLRTKVFEPIKDIRHLNPPKDIREDLEKRIEEAIIRAETYWAGRMCRFCV